MPNHVRSRSALFVAALVFLGLAAWTAWRTFRDPPQEPYLTRYLILGLLQVFIYLALATFIFIRANKPPRNHQ